MPSALGLRTTNRHPEYGDFVTGIFVLKGSSSDDFMSSATPSTVETRDVLMAVPLLLWMPAAGEQASIADTVCMLQARCIDAVEQGSAVLPMKQEATSHVEFELADGGLWLRSGTRHLGLLGAFPFAVDDRLAWFLTSGGTLAIAIQAPSRTWVATVASSGIPLVSVHRGSVASKQFEALMRHSTGWTFAHVGNPSLFADALESADHHYRVYSAEPDRVDLPLRLTYRGKCLGCDAESDSREHCVPNWMAADQGVMPVIAPLLCIDCNGYFGRTLEAPLARLVTDRALGKHLGSQLFTMWAIKTAVTLAAASNVRVDSTWVHQLRDGKVPAGFEVFASTAAKRTPGYDFAITYFSEADLQAGNFLTSFAMDGLVFCVARASPCLEAIDGLPRTHPAFAPATSSFAVLNLARIHGDLVTRVTGHLMGFTPSSMKRATGRKPGR